MFNVVSVHPTNTDTQIQDAKKMELIAVRPKTTDQDVKKTEPITIRPMTFEAVQNAKKTKMMSSLENWTKK